MISEAAVKTLALEKKAIEKMLAELEGNKVFLTLEEKLRKKARKGEWRLDKTWADITEIAGFAKKTFRTVYSYLCSYAHAGGLSGLQIGQVINVQDQERLSKFSLQFGLLLMSHFLFSYTSLFPETREVLEKDEEGYRLANKWFVTWKEDGFQNIFFS